MANPFREKIFEEKKEKEAHKPKKMELLSDMEHVEIKKLAPADLDDVYALMRKTLWESTKEQIADVIKEGMSYGAYVERMLVGAGLGWPAHYDDLQRGLPSSKQPARCKTFGKAMAFPNEKNKEIGKGGPNAIFMEDIALLLSYEGRGIMKMLVEEREKEAKEKGISHAVGFISPDWPKGNLGDMIKERGNRIEKIYLDAGYEFFRTKDGILAVKKL